MLDTAWPAPAHEIAQHEERDEADGQRDAHRQHPHDALAAAGVAIQEDPRREQRDDNGYQDGDDEDLHDMGSLTESTRRPALVPTLATIAVVAVCVSAGLWQHDRMQQK